tara:strand:+ start:42 stop:524 length:483 start_codon:yes stop_codon:yes gene_type:complete
MVKPIPMSVLSLDIGKKRIGIAGCDPLGITVTILPAIHRTSFHKDINILISLSIQRSIKGLIIGIPYNENGQLNKQAKYCLDYGIKVAKYLKLPLALVNEHSSTFEAARKYQLTNDKSGAIDSAAAAILLQQWLNEGPILKPVEISASSKLTFTNNHRSL